MSEKGAPNTSDPDQILAGIVDERNLQQELLALELPGLAELGVECHPEYLQGNLEPNTLRVSYSGDTPRSHRCNQPPADPSEVCMHQAPLQHAARMLREMGWEPTEGRSPGRNHLVLSRPSGDRG